MINTFEKEKLTALLKDFYTVVGIRIAIFDNDFNKLTEYPNTPPTICDIIRRTPEGLAACKECDQRAFERAKRKQSAHSYICHAGITEAITPIQLNGGVVGYAIFAHLMPRENYEGTVAEICNRCHKYADEETLENAVRELNTYSQKELSAAMRLLEAIASFLQYSNVVNWKNEDIVFNLNKYISENLAADLSNDILCSHFYISRTKLYQISMQAFGMGISQYVNYKRMDKAKELLADKSLSITEIARKVGFHDYNYFCKTFRKTVGLAPGKYRASVLKQ